MKYKLTVLDKNGTQFATGIYDVDALPSGDWLREGLQNGSLKSATIQFGEGSSTYIYERYEKVEE